MFNWLKEYFNYSKQEFRGVLILLILIFFIFVFPFFVNQFYKKETFDINNLKIELKNIEFKDTIPKLKVKKTQYFIFNPNTIIYKDMLRLGLSDKQAKIVINYRESGGLFFKPKDFKKVYSINDELYKKLEPYINIPKKNYTKDRKKHTVKDIYIKEKYRNVNKVEINTVDTIQLKKIKGIGSVLANRIIKYRNLLGGFYNKKQLLEVYGLDNDILSAIVDNISVDTLNIQKMNLNTISFIELNKHPYITYKDTKAIFKYRELMGKFKTVNDLINNSLIDIKTYNRVKCYFVVK